MIWFRTVNSLFCTASSLFRTANSADPRVALLELLACHRQRAGKQLFVGHLRLARVYRRLRIAGTTSSADNA